VKGNFGPLSIGSWVSFDGKWEKHETYGDQGAYMRHHLNGGGEKVAVAGAVLNGAHDRPADAALGRHIDAQLASHFICLGKLDPPYTNKGPRICEEALLHPDAKSLPNKTHGSGRNASLSHEAHGVHVDAKALPSRSNERAGEVIQP